ncbi:hypothetical protein [Natrinema sp. CGMCC1.2065]|uniref:hypothetical protein n=1 Tax=Natrinema sp. CGMCC1.2065 TaxID=3445767 RepID=UPI003F49F133
MAEPTFSNVREYVANRLDKASIDPRESPEDAFNVMIDACNDYIVSANHAKIEDHEYHYITSIRIADMVNASHRMYLEQVSEIASEAEQFSVSKDAVMGFAERSGRYTIGNTVTLIYSMAYELIYDMLGKLVRKLVDDDLPDSGKNAIVSQIGSYEGRAETLVACDIVDSDRLDDIKHVADVRAALVHDVEERFTLSVLDDLNKINILSELINDLYNMVYTIPIFKYHDDLELEDLIDNQ